MSINLWTLKNLESMTKLNLSGVAAVVDLKYSHLSNSADSVLLCGDNGLVILLKSGLVMSGGAAYTENLGVHNNIVFSVEWVDDSSFLTASADKTVCLWCLKSGKFVKKNVFLKHSSGVKTLSVSPDSQNVFVSGGRDGNIFLWDCRCNSTIQRGVKVYHKPVQSLMKAHEMIENFIPLRKKTKVISVKNQAVESLNGVTCVKWLSGHRLLSTAAADSSVLMWDFRKITSNRGNTGCSAPESVESFSYGGRSRKRIGYSNLVLSPHEDFFAASCTDNNIYEFNLSNTSASTFSHSSALSSVYLNPGGSSYFTKMDLDPSGSFILTGSCDNKAFVFSRGFTEQPVAELKSAHKEEVPCVSWHKFDPTFMLTACEEGIVSLWTKDFMLKQRYQPKQQRHNTRNAASQLCEDDFEVTGRVETNFAQLSQENICNVIQLRKTGIYSCRRTTVGSGKCQDVQEEENATSEKTLLSDKTNDVPSSSISDLVSPKAPSASVTSQARPVETSNRSTTTTIVTTSTCSNAAGLVCEELKNLPDFVKSPRHHLMSPPMSMVDDNIESISRRLITTPATCPSKSWGAAQTVNARGEGHCNSIVTPEKSQFMANFRSAFKPPSAKNPSSSPLLSPVIGGSSKKAARPRGVVSRKAPSSSQVTPLKCNNSIINALSPIGDFFRSSPLVKRKLDQL